jgi:hypothetical protein
MVYGIIDIFCNPINIHAMVLCYVILILLFVLCQEKGLLFLYYLDAENKVRKVYCVCTTL